MSDDKRADKQQHVNIFNKLISINKYEGKHNSVINVWGGQGTKRD